MPLARAQPVRKSAQPTLQGMQGVLPARQRRSQARQAALITAGMQLLESRDFHALSIAELAAATGYSVGSFYARFEDKDAFFSAVQATALEEMLSRARELLAPDRWARASAYEVLSAFVAFFAGTVRRHHGFMRAVLKHESTRPGVWTPFRACGAAMVAELRPVLAPKLTRIPPGQREARIGFATQILYGTLINAVLHDPGPLALQDQRLADELLRVLAGYLALTPPAKKPRWKRIAKT
jgi:AcrR family transcriptional regulator